MRNKIKEFLTEEEAGNILRQPRQGTLEGLRDYCILSLMLLTGIRRAEICDLARGNLKTEGKRVKLFIYGKGKKWRSIPIASKDLLIALAKYFKKVGTLTDSEAPMFFTLRSGKDGKPKKITWGTIRYIVAKYIQLAGIKKRITAHSFRHSFLTLTLQAGVDLKTVSVLAGHANVSITSTYLHTTEELKEAAIDKLRF